MTMSSPTWQGLPLPKAERLDQVTLDLPPPPSVNRLRRLNKTEMRYHGVWIDKCHRMVTKQFADAKLRGMSRPSFGEARVEVLVQLNENMKLRDADNAGKAVLDYLRRIEIIKDDSKQYVRRIVFEWVKPSDAPDGVRLTVVRI